MELINCLNNAALWLVNYIATKTTYKDFEIVKSDQVNDGVYVFTVKYTWNLNGWDKGVCKDVHVIYNKEKQMFVTADV